MSLTLSHVQNETPTQTPRITFLKRKSKQTRSAGALRALRARGGFVLGISNWSTPSIQTRHSARAERVVAFEFIGCAPFGSPLQILYLQIGRPRQRLAFLVSVPPPQIQESE
jgi:hypothetical protein